MFHVLKIIRLKTCFNQFTLFQILRKFKMSSQKRFITKSYLFLRDVWGQCTRYGRTCIMSIERRKHFPSHLISKRERCEITHRCHLSEFCGICCRHVIIVLFRNEITSLLERYIMQRWKRCVSRAHTRIAMNYADLVSIP